MNKPENKLTKIQQMIGKKKEKNLKNIGKNEHNNWKNHRN